MRRCTLRNDMPSWLATAWSVRPGQQQGQQLAIGPSTPSARAGRKLPKGPTRPGTPGSSVVEEGHQRVEQAAGADQDGSGAVLRPENSGTMAAAWSAMTA